MPSDEEKKKWREEFKSIIARSVGDEERAEIIMHRIADRLAGYSHEEVVQMHPMPEEQA